MIDTISACPVLSASKILAANTVGISTSLLIFLGIARLFLQGLCKNAGDIVEQRLLLLFFFRHRFLLVESLVAWAQQPRIYADILDEALGNGVRALKMRRRCV